jgi:hypothetical protein
MKRLLTAQVAALALVLFGGTGVQAASLPPDNVQWTYNFSPGAAAVTADANPSAGVSFTNEPTKAAVGSSDVVATNLRGFSTATSAAPDVMSSSGAYTLNLQLSTSDANGPHTATLSFSGKLTGKFSAESSNIRNVFGADSMQTVQLGDYNFTVSLFAYTPPGPPDQLNAGSISAYVQITAVTPAQLPEPSTMLLSGLGLTFLGGAMWRKRRQARPAVAV